MLRARAFVPGGPSALGCGRRALGVALGLALAAGTASAQTIYVAFGDSITEGVGDSASRPQKGYPPRLEDLLQEAGVNATVINRGVEGDTTAEGLSRIDSVLASTRADVLLLMEGTNDIPRVSNETIAFNLEEIGRRAAARGTRTVHATLFPRLPATLTDPNNVFTSELSGLIREMAARNRRELVDPFEVFLFGVPGALDRYFAPNDKFHPNAAGYDIMAQVFFEALTGIDRVPPVTGRIFPSNNSEDVPASTDIHVDVYDFGAGMDVAATRLLVNGERVDVAKRGESHDLTLTYDPPGTLRGVVTVELESEDLADPQNTVHRQVSRFVIAGTKFNTGDVDRDGRVDGVDMVRLALAFGSRLGEARYSSTVDFDSSGTVDGTDLALLAANFGRSSF